MLQPFEPGATFAGVYEIVKPLSSGGMGEVFVVRHRELGELRAMKLMHPQVGRDERLRAKFSQEARIGTRIKSEHVVRVLDVGVDAASHRPWFAMELLEGSDLRTFVDKGGPHSPEVIRKILGQLGHALSAAHRAGIVHRDLKPENIFVASSARLDEAFAVKVLDFGIAKVVAESNTDMSVPIGSPLWMAPEQAQAGASVGPQTDVWAVGLIAFYLLTGKIFWLAAHVPSVTAIQVLQETMIQAIPPASERAAALGYRFPLPVGFDAWFATAVARSGAERFPDASVAFERLSAVLGGRPSTASPSIPLPIGVATAPAMTPMRLDTSAPPFHTQMQAPLFSPATGVLPPEHAKERAKKGASPVVWIAVIGVVGALGVGAFLLKDRLFGEPAPKTQHTGDPVGAVAEKDIARTAPRESAAVITTAMGDTPTAAPAPTVSAAAPTVSSPPEVPTSRPTPTTGPLVKPTPIPTPAPTPTQDCKEKTYIGPDGKRVRKPWCPA
ncbi:MAG: protein kinase [Polyangiaceae bacterium]